MVVKGDQSDILCPQSANQLVPSSLSTKTHTINFPSDICMAHDKNESLYNWIYRRYQTLINQLLIYKLSTFVS